MDRDVLDRWCERGILWLVLGMLVSMPLAFGGRPQLPVGSWIDVWLLDPFLLVQWLALPLVGLWLVRLWLNSKARLFWAPISWAVLAFLAYALLRWRTADIEYPARLEVTQVLVYALLFFVILNHLHRQEAIQTIVFTLLTIAAVIACYAIYQFVTGSNRVWHVHKPFPHRGSGTYICPNHLGGFLEMLLPLGLACALVGRFKAHNKILLGYAALVILAGIAVTVSRGSWISTVLVLALFFLALGSHRVYRLPAAVLLVVLLGAAAFVVPRTETFQTRTKQLFVYGKLDDDARFSLWQPAWRIWKSHPLWGGGPASFDYLFRLYRPEEIQSQADRAHNDFLNLLADWGLAGFALVASAWALLGLGVAKTWSFVRNAPTDIGGRSGSTRFAFVLGGGLGLAAILFHSAVDFNMYIPANALLAVSLMALLTSHLRFATERYWLTIRWPGKLLLSGLLLSAGVALGVQSTRHAGENIWLARAGMISDPATPQRADFLEQAWRREPMNPETAYNLGEVYRLLSADGGDNSTELARQAMTWFERARKLNPWDSRANLGYGWCLDSTGHERESPPFFDRGERLDPNSYYTMNCIGLHYLQLLDYAAARPWFERSLALLDHPTSRTYLEVIERNLMSAATNAVTPVFQAGKGSPARETRGLNGVPGNGPGDVPAPIRSGP